MSVRRLDVPGVDDHTGAGVFYGAALSEAASCKGQHVFVVGGANSAGQATMLFSRYASKVTMLVRGSSIAASMSHYLVERIEETENVDVLTDAQVVSVHGERGLDHIHVDHQGEEKVFETSHVFIFIGARPRSECVSELVEMDEGGFILTGTDLVKGGAPAVRLGTGPGPVPPRDQHSRHLRGR